MCGSRNAASPLGAASAFPPHDFPDKPCQRSPRARARAYHKEVMEPTKRLSTCEAAEYVGLSARTLEKLCITGGGPEFLKPNRRVVYDRNDLDAWLAGKRRRSTSDAGASGLSRGIED